MEGFLMGVGKLQRVDLRSVWKHEASDFTTWLQENIDVLNDVVNMSLSNAEREQSAGAFSIDILAEDDSGNPVIIENQLGKSDHDHLGKIITYLTAIDSKVAIWIVADPRPEHVRAVSWLNEFSPASFYLIKVEAVRIEDSLPAPLLTLIVGPSEEGREVGQTKKELAERHKLRKRFWTLLLERAKEKTSLHAGISPGQYGWIGTGAGKYGLGFSYVVRQHDASVELYIDRGKGSQNENKAIFDQLFRNREEVEAEFGGPLEWQRLDDRRACRIRKVVNIGGYRDEEEIWGEIHDAMIDAMIRLERSLRPQLKKVE
jgi:hypothetical protein